MDGLVCGHELESLDGIVLVSRANQAAAFERIARSSRSWRPSRRSRRSSSRSSVVRPSVRSPASRAACFIQFRIAWADGSNWRANSSGVRPLRTSSMSRCRNSGGYGRWLLGIVDAPFRPNDGVSTKPGAASTDRRNRPAEHFGWFHPTQRLSRAVVEVPSDPVQLGSGIDAELGIPGEVLAEQAVAVFIAAALPRAVRIAEEDADVGVDGELHVLGHFLALVPGECAA